MQGLPVSFIFLCIFTCSCVAMTMRDYIDKQKYNVERQYSPITTEMCRMDSKFQRLRSCYLAQKDKKTLQKYSKMFLSPANFWESETSQSRRGVGNSRVSEMLKRLYESGTRRNYDDDDDRRKRSASEEHVVFSSGISEGHVYNTSAVSEELMLSTSGLSEEPKLNTSGISEENVAHIRTKRQVYGNPCVHGRALRTTILYGIDSETGHVVELFQDIESHLYQTFYTRKCIRRTVFRMMCVPQYVEFITSVYKGNTYEVITRSVKIPTSCAMVFS